MIFQNELSSDVARTFQFDYIYFDAIWLTIYVLITLILARKLYAMKVAAVFAILIYFIDAGVWFMIMKIRHYYIDGVEILGWSNAKFAADFMMTISYGLIAFSWEFVLFEAYAKKDWKSIGIWSALLLGGWLLIPALSQAITWNEIIIFTYRDMTSQMWLQIIATVAGYLLLILMKYNKKLILFLFCMGLFQAFAMEFPLNIFGIRPGWSVFIFELFFLINEGMPYIYIMHDKLFPWLGKKILKR